MHVHIYVYGKPVFMNTFQIQLLMYTILNLQNVFQVYLVWNVPNIYTSYDCQVKTWIENLEGNLLNLQWCQLTSHCIF